MRLLLRISYHQLVKKYLHFFTIESLKKNYRLVTLTNGVFTEAERMAGHSHLRNETTTLNDCVLDITKQKKTYLDSTIKI